MQRSLLYRVGYYVCLAGTFALGDLCLTIEAKGVVTTVSVLRKGSFLKRYRS